MSPSSWRTRTAAARVTVRLSPDRAGPPEGSQSFKNTFVLIIKSVDKLVGIGQPALAPEVSTAVILGSPMGGTRAFSPRAAPPRAPPATRCRSTDLHEPASDGLPAPGRTKAVECAADHHNSLDAPLHRRSPRSACPVRLPA